MRLKAGILTQILEESVKELSRKNGNRGLESIIQSSTASILAGTAKREVSLEDIGAMQAWGRSKGNLDILLNEKHGIEIKVVQMPRINSSPSNSLYDVGQLASDYWRLQNSKLDSAELLILLTGCMINDFKKPIEILREFHNRMFVDYSTSIYYGELSVERNLVYRAREIASIYQMGFDKPYEKKLGKIVITSGSYSLVTIPVYYI